MNSFDQIGQFGNALTGFSNFAQNFNYPMKHEIITVSGLDEVKNFKLNKGDSYDLLDPNTDTLYIKERDNIGRETIKIYSLTDITEKALAESEPANISRQEYDSLMNKLDNLLNRVEVKNAVKKSETAGQSELNFGN